MNLIIGSDVLRRAPVDDATDRGFVDAHAEGHGGDDHRYLPVHEVLLNRAPLAVLQARVVGFAGKPFLAKLLNEIEGVGERVVT